jgi:hypothetical protein
MTAMPIRDNRPGDQDHAREYDEKTGGWTKPVAPEKR